MFGGYQLQVSAGQAVMGAVDEQVRFADQCLALGDRQQVKQHLGIAGGRVCIDGHTAVEELITHDGAIAIHDGLPCHGDGGRGGWCGGRFWVSHCVAG